MGNSFSDCLKNFCDDVFEEDEPEISKKMILDNPYEFIIWVSKRHREELSLYKNVNNRSYYTFEEIYRKYIERGGSYQRENFRNEIKKYFSRGENIKYHYSTEDGVFAQEGKYTKTGLSFNDYNTFDSISKIEEVSSGNITPVFKNVKEHLIKYILRSDQVVGCVECVKDPDICEILNTKSPKIIINENNSGLNYNWTKRFSDKEYFINKFVVFRRFDVLGNYVNYAVFTGSFNFTKNASKSLENAVYIDDPIIANKYYEIFEKIWDNREIDLV